MCTSRRKWCVAIVILAFTSICLVFLNDDVYMDPDSTEYMLLARSLATGSGYRDISHPDWPRNNLKPPGLPVLLVPAAIIAPYSVVAAKLSMVLMAAGLLLAFWLVATRVLRPASAVFVFIVLATSPATFWFARDLLSEVPYTACTLLVVALEIDRSVRDDNSNRRVFGFESVVRFLIWLAFIAFIPFIRAVGLALVMALMVPTSESWKGRADASILSSPWSKKTLVVLSTVAPYVLWSLACAARQGELPYSWWFSLERFSAVWEWTYVSFGFYVDAVGDYVLGSVPTYCSALLGALAVLGMIATRRSGGLTLLMYFLIYLLVVSIYPCRHPRLVWPLVPFALIWCARGLEILVMPWLGPSHKSAILRPAVFVLGTLWIAAQLFACASWVGVRGKSATNARRWGDLPWHAWGDWQGAAEWLKANAPTYARVLTRNKCLGLWSDRLQSHVVFERMGASELEDALRTARAQFVVLGYWGVGALLPADRMSRNPIYNFEQAADFRGVRIYRVNPNRSGTVPEEPPDYAPFLARLDSNEIVSEPGEDQDITRCHILRRAGRAAEAIPILQRRIHGSPEVPYVLEMATCLIDVGEYSQAIKWFHRAAEIPGGDLYRANIAAGIQVAEQFLVLEDPSASFAKRVDASLRIAAGHIEMGRYQPALELIEKCLEQAPLNAACLYARGTILQRLGRRADAIDALESALQHGAREAVAKLLLLKTAEVIDGAAPADIYVGERRIVVDPTTSQDHLNLATLATHDGIPGFGLAVLERAQRRFPDDAAVAQELGELYELFGEWELAAAAWNRSLELRPDPATASQLYGVQKKMSQRPRP